MKSEIVSAEDKKTGSIGLVGKKIMALARDAQNEIETRWNESTMEKIKANGVKLVEEANDFKITDQNTFNNANQHFVQISQYKKEGGAFIEPLVEAMHHPHAMTCDIRREFYDPADMAKKIFEKKINEWKIAERKRIEAEQNRLNAERKAKEEAERQRLEEKVRLEREKAENERREAEKKAAAEREKAAQARRDQEAAEARARKAEADRLAAEKAAKDAKEESAHKAAQAEAERIAAEKAAKAAKDEKSRKAAQAEADRLAAEKEKAKAEETERIRAEMAEADRLAEEKEKAEAEAKDRSRTAFKAEQQAHKETSNGEIAAQKREQTAEAHEANAQAVFTPPTIAVPTVKKTEVTPIGKAIGKADWEVTILDEMELVKAVAAGQTNGGFPLSVLNLDPERVKAALKRWAKMSLTTQRYEGNGVFIEATERLSARVNSKAKAGESKQ